LQSSRPCTTLLIGGLVTYPGENALLADLKTHSWLERNPDCSVKRLLDCYIKTGRGHEAQVPDSMMMMMMITIII
jgi:hypothetical protein